MADSALQTMADKLADECIAVQKEVGNDRLFLEVATAIGAASQTLEEAFLTSVRTKMAAVAGRRFLATKLAEHRARTSDG